ncbi:hypothetical protein JHK82_043143 [Glycine max]|nr:hypothetical protein JHK82_043143 [Glycine max]
MDELRERAKGYIQMDVMSRFWNKDESSSSSDLEIAPLEPFIYEADPGTTLEETQEPATLEITPQQAAKPSTPALDFSSPQPSQEPSTPVLDLSSPTTSPAGTQCFTSQMKKRISWTKTSQKTSDKISILLCNQLASVTSMPSRDDPIVVSIVIANFMVSKALIDEDSSTDILYWKTFHKLEVSPDTI